MGAQEPPAVRLEVQAAAALPPEVLPEVRPRHSALQVRAAHRQRVYRRPAPMLLAATRRARTAVAPLAAQAKAFSKAPAVVLLVASLLPMHPRAARVGLRVGEHLGARAVVLAQEQPRDQAKQARATQPRTARLAARTELARLQPVAAVLREKRGERQVVRPLMAQAPAVVRAAPQAAADR